MNDTQADRALRCADELNIAAAHYQQLGFTTLAVWCRQQAVLALKWAAKQKGDKMTTQEWIAQARENETKLAALIWRYHPVLRRPLPEGFTPSASGAQAACEVACAEIKKEWRHTKQVEVGTGAVQVAVSPVAMFHKALAEENAGDIYSLLNSAWFGVPETTGCWTIEGFSEAVSLLEDPPDDMEEQDATEAA